MWERHKRWFFWEECCANQEVFETFVQSTWRKWWQRKWLEEHPVPPPPGSLSSADKLRLQLVSSWKAGNVTASSFSASTNKTRQQSLVPLPQASSLLLREKVRRKWGNRKEGRHRDRKALQREGATGSNRQRRSRGDAEALTADWKPACLHSRGRNMAGNNTNILLEILGSFDTGEFNSFSVHKTFGVTFFHDFLVCFNKAAQINLPCTLNTCSVLNFILTLLCGEIFLCKPFAQKTHFVFHLVVSCGKLWLIVPPASCIQGKHSSFRNEAL